MISGKQSYASKSPRVQLLSYLLNDNAFFTADLSTWNYQLTQGFRKFRETKEKKHANIKTFIGVSVTRGSMNKRFDCIKHSFAFLE